ncbi:uncharacterized protein F5Z01DRAFT_697713 [Emericellopsis atlantica]|uniref:Uncharacterized protein n=1 Tax=Emericellopsis atlantica TaxID=2614577 RepID=A0A9P7ZDQ3_9HYPO|nr:uncharacterized protein F5Z01DRAFT_697713 [Emericellopsis atlantica]KAG9249573.1 hypothetical protein F5Z01DRAFT_697713 [Emericellopsis atlantica]
MIAAPIPSLAVRTSLKVLPRQCAQSGCLEAKVLQGENVSTGWVPAGTTLRDINQLLQDPNGEKIDSSQNIRRTLDDRQIQLKDLAERLEPAPTLKRLVWPLKKEEVDAITEKLGQCRSAISFDLRVY